MNGANETSDLSAAKAARCPRASALSPRLPSFASVKDPSSVLRPLSTTSRVALLTAGRDKPYALGLAAALLEQGVHLDFIGSDEVSSPALRADPRVHFLNLRGDQSENAPLITKIRRVLTYYIRLIRYAASSKPR